MDNTIGLILMEDSVSNKKFQEYKLLTATTPPPIAVNKLSN